MVQLKYLNLEEIIAFLTLTYLSYTQVLRIARECNVDLSLTERKKREEETDETDETDGKKNVRIKQREVGREEVKKRGG